MLRVGSIIHLCEAFNALLPNNLTQAWRSQGKRGIWLKLPKERASLIPSAIQSGFDFHHADPVSKRETESPVFQEPSSLNMKHSFRPAHTYTLPACESAWLHLSQGHVMLTAWLPTEPSTLPPNASHQVCMMMCHRDITTQVYVNPRFERTGWCWSLGLE